MNWKVSTRIHTKYTCTRKLWKIEILSLEIKTFYYKTFYLQGIFKAFFFNFSKCETGLWEGHKRTLKQKKLNINNKKFFMILTAVQSF